MVAAVNLARPYSNAQQECDFSMATWFDRNLVWRQKPLILEKRLVGSLSQQVVRQMQSLLQKLNTDIIEVIDIDHNTTVNDDNQDPRNQNGINDDSVMQLQLQSDQNKYDMEDVILNDHDDSVMKLQLQSDQNKYDMEDVILNDHDMLSNDVLHID